MAPTEAAPTEMAPNDYRIAMIAAQWHAELVDVATTSCRDHLLEAGVAAEAIRLITVPGSLELPLVAQLAATSGDFDAVLAFGLVVDGGIYRHEFVANAILNGFVAVSTATEVPVLSAVLTPQRFDENDPGDLAFFAEHLVGKGIEIARSALEVVPVVRALRQEVR